MPDLRTLDFRCAFIIEAAEQPARFHKDVDLQTMLGKAQKVPNKTQRDRAHKYRQSQDWPKSCHNSKGRGGIGPHAVQAPAWRGELSAEHFYEPWHLYCKKCHDADCEAQGDGRWEPDEGAKPPPSWSIGDPYPAVAALTRSSRSARPTQAAASTAPTDAAAVALHAYACGLVRQTLKLEGDDVELPAEGEPFDLRAINNAGERLVFVRVDAAGEPTDAEAALLQAHAGQCWLAVVQNITVKVLSSGPMPLGGRVAPLVPWA